MKKILFSAALIALWVSCDPSKKVVKNNNTNFYNTLNLDTIAVRPQGPPEPEIYRASETRVTDIIHTRLDVRFDWAKAHLLGKATITAKPYFHPSSTLLLDARGFDIHEVSLVTGDVKKKLEYTYKDDVITIQLDKEYKRDESYKVFIDYTSKPNELKSGGSAAINSDKGLYFINNEGKEKNKPMQIWTQGETQSNSAWFPTIDKPNERMTTELFMTVDKKYTTLSNGDLAFSTDNADGTRTDCWKMELPHAPYLVMMAVGEYAVVKDKWRDKQVNYYVEKEYEPYAKAIFGNTPEMMEFYSNKLGVAYPWSKYSQVVVRDYVSGAMENTTATVHGEFLQRTDRELLDNTNEDVVAHEMFHQWFGDLVTCESWSNLPLNESFATYGEYLWIEYKYGRDEADDHLDSDLYRYLSESMRKQVDLVRFNYDDREDMFDGHSYQKGGRVLHMLRKYVGDDAFFASLKLYLEKNKYTAVEIHQLRLAFEEVTGEDLNWFFNQWFLSKGHPDLQFSHQYDSTSRKVLVTIKQKQDFSKTAVFRLPMAIDIYAGGTKERHNIVVEKSGQEFLFSVKAKPDLVNIDAEKMLLCTKKDQKTNAELVFMFNNAPLFLDRAEAIEQLGERLYDSLAKRTVMKALDDKFHGIRQLAIQKLSKVGDPDIRPKLVLLAQKDEKAAVRSQALDVLNKRYQDAEMTAVNKALMNDRSYSVVRSALNGVTSANSQEGIKLAKELEGEKNAALLSTIASIYANHGTDENNDFFLKTVDRFNGFEQITFVTYYTMFLKKCKDETINTGLPLIENIAKNGSNKWVKYYGKSSLNGLLDMYTDREGKTQQKITDLKETSPTAPSLKGLEDQLEQIKSQKAKISEMLKGIN